MPVIEEAPVTFVLEPTERLSTDIKRIAGGQLDHAVASLLDPDVDDATAVHEARKSLKKVRAILRLIADEIDEDAYRSDTAAFRGIGVDLSPVRDAAVALETFDRYCEPQLDPEDSLRLRAVLVAARGGAFVGMTLRERTAARIRLERWRIDEWAIDRRDARAIVRGLRRAFKKVRSAYAAVLEDHSDESLHEWRKKVKVVWYHSRLLRARDADGPHRDVVELSQLSELLGLDRDLALVRSTLHESGLDDAVSRIVLMHIDDIRSELQSQSKSLGARLFEQRPKDYVARLLARFGVPSRDALETSTPRS